ATPRSRASTSCLLSMEFLLFPGVQVQKDLGKVGGESLQNGLILGHRPVHLVLGQLNKGGISPQSNAKIGEAQGEEGVLAPLHPGQIGGGDGGARGNAGGQTGVGG